MTLSEAHCYRLLGLSNASTLQEIRSAYRRIARRMHPDRAGGDAERFKEITAAYNQLVGRATGRIPAEEKPRKRPARPKGRPQAGGAGRRSRARAQSQRQSQRPHAEQGPRQQQARTASTAGARPGAQSSQADRDAQRRARARNARRKAWNKTRAQAEDRWDEEFAEAWSAWCRTAERFHAEDARRRAERTAQADSAADDAAEASARAADDAAGPSASPEDSVESRSWVPPRVDTGDAEGQGDDSGSFFERMRTGWKKVRRKVALDRVGHDVSLRLPIDPTTQLFGGTRRVAITRAAACPTCAGDGDASCICGGRGRIKVRETVSVAVPPGARASARLRIEGKGTAGLDGAADGDLYLLLEPQGIPGFDREGLDLRGTVTLSGRLAGQGGTVTVELPRGKVKLTVPPKTRAGDTFRLRGQGLPAWGEDTRGDLFLSVAVR